MCKVSFLILVARALNESALVDVLPLLLVDGKLLRRSVCHVAEVLLHSNS